MNPLGWSRYGLARNACTGHIYTGINAFILNLFCEYPIPYYLSFKQAKAMGGKIRKGAKAERVYFYKSYYKDESGKNINAEQAQAINEMGGDDEIDNSAAYLEGWLKVLREDNKLIFKAAADAQKAVNYILGE